jgi:hypothetical protein
LDGKEKLRRWETSMNVRLLDRDGVTDLEEKSYRGHPVFFYDFVEVESHTTYEEA